MRLSIPAFAAWRPAARLGALLVALGLTLALAPAARAAGFGLDEVDRMARTLAAGPYRPPQPVAEAVEAREAYDRYRSIRFLPERAAWRAEGLPFELHFFPAGGAFTQPVHVYEVVDGRARPLAVRRGDFANGALIPADPERPGDEVALAGFRVAYPLHRPQPKDEVIAFLGASYFRAIGQQQQYGLSARGLAVDTTGGAREEFPAFTRFWLHRPAADARALVVDALLEGPRVTGAYRFTVTPGPRTVVDVQARVHLRAAGAGGTGSAAGPIRVVGLAPLTSMFFSGENQPAAGDFRPEVHDSDGLQLALPVARPAGAAAGAAPAEADTEWLWRPLVRPAAPFATAFAAPAGIRGFGLMQRDRRFASYEDLEARYHRRPSAWVEPLGDWGPGRVELLQLPAASEADDNIVAFWAPDAPPQPGQPLALAWRIHWAGDDMPRPPAATAVQTRVGMGYRRAGTPASRMLVHIDFAGPALAALAPDAAVEAVASGLAGVRDLRVRVEPNPYLNGWRAVLEFDRIDPRTPVELRAFLRHAGHTLTETWAYALPPEP